MSKMNYHAIFLTLAMATLIQSRISPGERFDSSYILKDDVLFEDLSVAFDLSKASYPIIGNADLGVAKAFYDYYQVFPMEESVNASNFMKSVDNHTVVAVYDFTKLLVATLTPNGLTIEEQFWVDLTVTGAKYFCSDAVMNEARALIYIACFDKMSHDDEDASTNALFVHTISITDKNVTASTSIKQSTQNVVRGRAKMFLLPAGSVEEEDYLIVYDQQNLNAKTTLQNNYVRVFRNVDSGDLKYLNLFQENALNMTAYYDFDSYEGSILLTGRSSQTPDYLSMGICKVDISQTTLSCNPTLKFTIIKNGKIGVIEEENIFYQFNVDSKEIDISSLQGRFFDKNWNTKVVLTLKDIDIYDINHSWISEIQVNEFGATIDWVDRTGNDVGSTLISWDVNEGATRDSTSSAMLQHIVVQTRIGDEGLEIGLIWPHQPYYLLKGSDLSKPFETENIGVTLQDMSNKLTITKPVTLIDNIFAHVDFIASAKISVNRGDTEVVGLNQFIDAGNSLISATVTHSETDVAFISHEETPIVFEPTIDLSKVSVISFSSSAAMIQLEDDSVNIYECEDGPIINENRVCKLQSYIKIDPKRQEKVSEKFLSKIEGIYFFWTSLSTPSVSKYYLAQHDTQTIFSFELDAPLFDAMYVDFNDTHFIVGAVFNDSVRLIAHEKPNIQNKFTFETLDSSNCNYPYFCPKQVRTCPFGDNVLEVMSSCTPEESRLLKYTLDGLKMRNTLPIVHPITEARYCPMGGEFIFYSANDRNAPVYGASTYEDMNYFSVPLDQINADKGYDFFCLPEASLFTISGGSDATGRTVTVVRGNIGDQQQVRYAATFALEKNTHVKSFPFSPYDNINRAIHVIFDSASNTPSKFLLTYERPLIVVQVAEETPSNTGEIKINFLDESKTIRGTLAITVNYLGNVEKSGKRMFFK